MLFSIVVLLSGLLIFASLGLLIGAESWAGAFFIGLILHYLFSLVLDQVMWGLMLSAGLSVVGLPRVWSRIQQQLKTSLSRRSRVQPRVQLGVLIYLAVIFTLKMLADPLQAQDARSVWFFHPKLIAFAGGRLSDVPWNLPELRFTHSYYPKLVAVLSSQVMILAKNWNELLPKLSLAYLFIPALVFFYELKLGALAFAFLVFGVVLRVGGWFWIGYMDGYLALYAAISVIALLRRDWASMIGALGLCAAIKNEGWIWMLALGLSVAVLRIRRPFQLSFQRKVFLWGSVALAPGIVWSVWKKHLAISSDYSLGMESLSRGLGRFVQGDGSVVLRGLMSEGHLGKGVLVFFLVLGLSMFFKKEKSPEIHLTLTSALIYFLGMCVVFLLTPFEVNWQIQTAGERTMMLPLILLFVAGVQALNAPLKQKPPRT